MGAKVSNQNKNNLLIEQAEAEEVIEYEGYEEFPIIEVAKNSATKIEKIRPNPSLNNHSGGSSIGKYESENYINKSKDLEENAKAKEDSKFQKEKSGKKEEEININNDDNENNENNNIVLVNNNIEENKEQEKEEEKDNVLRAQNKNIQKVEINLEEQKPEEISEKNGGDKINEEIDINLNNENNGNINEKKNENYKDYKNGITEIKEEDINYNENDEKEKINPEENNNDINDNNDFTEEKKPEIELGKNYIENSQKAKEINLNYNNDEKEINNIEEKKENENNMNNNENNDLAPKKIILPDITTIISEKVLEEGAGNELLFMSYLNKIVHISIKERVKYSEKFCITSKDNFLIYENKDNYIQVKKPLAIIPISSIKNVVLFKLSKRIPSYDHFYIEFDLDENNKNNVYDKIDTFYENSLDNKTNENLNNTAMVMFKTEEKNLAKEWYVLLKYLINLKLKN